MAAWKKTLKEIMKSVKPKGLRLMLKMCGPDDVMYLYGYTQKDIGQSHYMQVSGGMTQQDMENAKAVYLERATKSAFSSHKLNPNPGQAERPLSFCTGNQFKLSTWFIHSHNLGALKQLLGKMGHAMIMTWALETGNYYIQAEFVTGKNGGGVLDPARSRAYFQLSLIDDFTSVSITEVRQLVETVLYGTHLEHSTERTSATMPSCDELASYRLHEAKNLCINLAQNENLASGLRTAAGGDFVVVDFLTSSTSAVAASTMRTANLSGTTMFTTTQDGRTEAGRSVRLPRRGVGARRALEGAKLHRAHHAGGRDVQLGRVH